MLAQRFSASRPRREHGTETCSSAGLCGGPLLAASVSATPLGSSASTQTTAGTAAFPSDARAPAFSSADLAAVPGANWITNGGRRIQRPLLVAQSDQHVQRREPEGGMARPPRRLGQGGEVLGRGNAGRLQRRHVPPDRQQRRVRDRSPRPGSASGRITRTSTRPSTRPAAGGTTAASRSAKARSSSRSSTARLVALDQMTGEVLWKIIVHNWREGYTLTAAPLYYNGASSTSARPAASS